MANQSREAYRARVREYMHKRWQNDPEFRNRHRVAARESARRKRRAQLELERNTFPFGYRLPRWLFGSDDDLIAHFMEFIDCRFNNPVLTHCCFEHRFHPSFANAESRWAEVVVAATELCEGFNPVTNQFEEKNEPQTPHVDG